MGGLRVVTGLRRNGEEFPLDASISQVVLHGWRYYTVILRDVTERVRAEEALARSREELHEIATASATAREQEKKRLARELHDELGQMLTAIKLDVDHLAAGPAGADAAGSARLAAMRSLVDQTVASTRRISSELRPMMLDDLGLAAAAQWLTESFAKRYGIACALEVEPPELELAEPEATSLYRILQEALTNVARHAQATRVHVRLRRGEGEAWLTVRDDGRGFDPSAPTRPNAFGLVGLRERAYLVNGRIRIESAPGKGTCVEVVVPLPP
jgi:signal transduction histidine kinase